MGRTKVDYKERIVEALEDLSLPRLRSVLDYIGYLRDREAWLESQEILSNQELIAQLKEADEEWKEGNYRQGDYIEWRPEEDV